MYYWIYIKRLKTMSNAITSRFGTGFVYPGVVPVNLLNLCRLIEFIAKHPNGVCLLPYEFTSKMFRKRYQAARPQELSRKANS